MQKFSDVALPLDFYDPAAWHDRLMAHYCDEKQYVPREVLARPITMLTRDIAQVIDIYGDYPKPVYDGLKQAIDPLFSPEEYEERIYLELLSIIDRKKRKDLTPMVKALRRIRLLFQQDEMFLRHFFEQEINMAPALDNPKGKYDRFAKLIQMITKAHILEIVGLIASRI